MELIKGDKLLSRAQCDILRGLAIIGIFLHNFCHWLHGAIKENEYAYTFQKSEEMWNYWFKGNIDWYFPIQFFSFFGHYGVPLFLFLSGYGLVRKYEQNTAETRLKILPFIGYHWLKLFRLMILGFLLSVTTYLLCGTSWRGILDYLAQAAMINNLLCIDNTIGPYWFFGLMLEVYVLYIIFYYPSHSKANSVWRWLVPIVFIVITWLLQAFLSDFRILLNNLRHNAVIAMLPFSLGVLVARYGFPKLSKWVLALVAVMSLVGVAITNMHYQLWLWSPVFVIAGAVSFVKCVERILIFSPLLKPVAWMGVMSSFIFVVHSIPRLPMFQFILWRQRGIMPTDYAWLVAYIVLTLILAWLYKMYLELIPSPRLKGNKITFYK